MPRKTLALLVGLILVTVILFLIALQTGKNQSKTAQQQSQAQATPTPDVMHTTLSMSPDVIQVAPGGIGTAEVMADTSDNQVTAVQLELLYDPTMLSNVKVTVGPAFANPVVLIDRNDATTGKYTYAYGIQPGQKPVNGQITVAKITFTARGALGKQSQIIMQPTTLVTARGVAGTVLKKGTGATVVIAASAKTNPVTPKTTTSAGSGQAVTAPVTSKAPTK